MWSIRSLRARAEKLITDPGQEVGRWARVVRFHLQLWRFCARRLWENNVTAMSAALSFRTIFAMIPAMVLVVLLLKSVGVLEDGKQSVRGFLDRTGFAQIAVVEKPVVRPDEASETPVESEKILNVADEIVKVVERVEAKLSFRHVGPVGVVLFIWTALTLLTTMERSLNRIFGAKRARPLGRRVLLYWSALTLGPLLLIAAAYAGRSLTQSFEHIPGWSVVSSLGGHAVPALVGILVVAALYKLMPHTDVRYRAAVGGALVSVPLWMVAKWGFAVYINKLVGTGNLYGALGLLPLFFIWLNLSWLIFLFGAQLSHTAFSLATLSEAELASRRKSVGPFDLLAAAMTVAIAYRDGRGAVAAAEVAGALRLRPDRAIGALEKLQALGVVRRVEEAEEESEETGGGAYLPAKPAERILVMDVLGLGQEGSGGATESPTDVRVARLVRAARAHAHAALGAYTLADALRERELHPELLEEELAS